MRLLDLAGHEDHTDVGGLFIRLEASQYLVSIHIRHRGIEQDQADLLLSHALQRGDAVLGQYHPTFVLEQFGKRRAIDALVIHDQHRGQVDRTHP
ncbi:hypothetical protein D3C71_2015580 [compost metagenome]